MADFYVPSNRVNISIGQVIFLDPDTGSTLDVTSEWESNSCSSGMDLSDASCQFSSSSSDGQICNNALVQLSYLILHSKDTQGTITEASARLIISDIAFSDYAGSSQTQLFGIDFFDDNNAYDGGKTGVPLNRFGNYLL